MQRPHLWATDGQQGFQSPEEMGPSRRGDHQTPNGQRQVCSYYAWYLLNYYCYAHTPTVDCTLVTAFIEILIKLTFTWPAGYIYDLFL